MYAMVARGTTVLCDYTVANVVGNVGLLSRKILKKIHKSKNKNKKITYVHQGYTYNFQRVGSLSFMCMAQDAFGRHMPFFFLKDISEAFFKMFPNLKAETAEDVHLETDGDGKEMTQPFHKFTEVLRDKMQKFVVVDPQHDTLSKIERGIHEVQNVIQENITNVLIRGSKIETLVDKTDKLSFSSEVFKRTSQGLRTKLCMANVKYKIFIFLICFFISYLMISMVCGFNFGVCF